MSVKSLFPVVMTDRLAESRDFYAALLDTQLAFESDWYVQLLSPTTQDAQLGLVLGSHESVRRPSGGPRPESWSRSRSRTSTSFTSARRRAVSPSSCRSGTKTGASVTSSPAIRTDSPSTWFS
jgi:hypothetical protein